MTDNPTGFTEAIRELLREDDSKGTRDDLLCIGACIKPNLLKALAAAQTREPTIDTTRLNAGDNYPFVQPNDWEKAHGPAIAVWRKINTETRLGSNKVIDPDHAIEIISAALTAVAQTAPATDADMRAFGASEAACYYWPDGSDEHKALRAAYCQGAAECRGFATPGLAPDTLSRAEAISKLKEVRDELFDLRNRAGCGPDQEGADVWQRLAEARKVLAPFLSAARSLPSGSNHPDSESIPNKTDLNFGHLRALAEWYSRHG